MTPDPRWSALRAINAVLDRNLSLDQALADELPSLDNPSDRALTQRLTYATLRWLSALEAIADALLNKPLPRKHADIRRLLCLGLVQLWRERMPVYAAINSTVALCQRLQKPWARGLVNAVLRQFQRSDQPFLERVLHDDAERYAVPPWLLATWQQDWPEEWPALAAASLQEPPQWLRVNRLKVKREFYLETLASAGIKALPGPGLTDLRVLSPLPVERLPGFAEGKVSVQDTSAQAAVPLLDLNPGQRVLDACAAPGGKTCQILETEPRLARLLALDRNTERLHRLHDNLTRLGLGCDIRAADAARPDQWWDGQAFDRILVDAPCTGTGVIRRHPDIKWRLQPEDPARLAAIQAGLLAALWPLLRPGGMLLYVTCSVCARENTEVVDDFLRQNSDAAARALHAPAGRALAPGWQIQPGEADGDGLYFALLERRA